MSFIVTCSTACRSSKSLRGLRQPVSSTRSALGLLSQRLLSSSPGQVSTLLHHAGSTARQRKATHRLFLAGVNPFLPSHLQSSISPVFTEVPLDEWISSISGRNAGISIRQSPLRGSEGGGIRKEDIEVTHLASGLGHAMIAYRDRRTDDEKIFAIGRNESGQLGVGYNSQEPTRGLVEGFEGDHIEAIKCGITSTYVQVRQGDKSVLFVCGNQHRGQLGIPAPEKGQSPSQAFLSSAIKVELPGQSIKQIACGYEHLLVLTEQGLLLGTGINTDGQLGTGDDEDRHILSPVKLSADIIRSGIFAIDAGADISSIITSEGSLHTFGNSEYAQAFHGEKIDRVMEAKTVDRTSFGSGEVRSFQTAGSASLLLDEHGQVFTAGFGAIGQGEDTLSCIQPTRIAGLNRINAVYAGYSCALAVDKLQDMHIMGLNTVAGRLGVAGFKNVYLPCKLPRLLPDGNSEWEIADVAIGRETILVHVVDYSAVN